MQAIDNRRDAAKALVAKWNAEHGHEMYYKRHLGDWLKADMRELHMTTARARKADGVSYDHMVEHAVVNVYGYVFVNGTCCGHLG